MKVLSSEQTVFINSAILLILYQSDLCTIKALGKSKHRDRTMKDFWHFIKLKLPLLE
ncbi:hypothetical protein [Scytonema sp. NUACC21]